MDRAYSTFEIKAVTDAGGKRTFTGIASTVETDRMGDIVEPEGAKFKLPIPLLWQHDSERPIGWVRAARVSAKKIEVDCEIADVTDPPSLKQRLDEAWSSIKTKLVRGLSIGFNPIESNRIEGTYSYRFVAWELLELSAVTIPANASATITSIKALDATQRKQGSSPPGVSGTPTKAAKSGLSLSRNLKGRDMKSLREELIELRQQRTEKAARMAEINELVTTEDRDINDEEDQEFDTLKAEVKTLDAQIRTKEVQAINADAARPVLGKSSEEGSRSRGPTVFARKADPEDKFKGQSFTRIVIAKALARLSGDSALAIAEQRWGKSHPKFVQFMKAAVAGGGTGSGEWGAEWAATNAAYTGDFVEFLYAKTVFDQLPLREVPARVAVKGVDGAATGYWVGESKAIPMSKMDGSTVDLSPLKVAALTVLSNELIADSSPSAEMIVRDGLAEASAQRIDTTFLSASAASAGVSPAGLLNGVTAINASGTDAAAVRADVQGLLYPFVTGKNASGIVLVMNPATGLALSMLVNALGQSEFPGINENGGTFQGRRVVVGDNVTPGNIIAIRPQDVWKIGDTGVQVSMSDVATIEQNDAPAGATDTPTAMASHYTSMFQEESTAFKVVRRINFQKRRSNAVAFIQDAEYGGVVS